MKNSGNVLMHTELEYEKIHSLNWNTVASRESKNIRVCFRAHQRLFCVRSHLILLQTSVFFYRHHLHEASSIEITIRYRSLCKVLCSTSNACGSHSTTNVSRVEMACDIWIDLVDFKLLFDVQLMKTEQN